MTYNTLLYEKEDGIGIITVNRPKELNAQNSKMLAELTALLTDIEVDDERLVSILILSILVGRW